MGSRKRETPPNIVDGMSSNQRSILDLPTHLTMEILSRAPVKTLLKCRCVCKTWKNLLSDPHFIKLHFSRTPINLFYKTYPPDKESSHLNLVDFRGANTNCSRDAIMKTRIPVFDIPCYLLNSCNGLLCLCDYGTDCPSYVCNPILGEYIALPKVQRGSECSGGSGFGFCPETNQYKVVRNVRRRGSKSRHAPCDTQIYALGEGKWRSVGNAPYSFPKFQSAVNGFVHGALHWADFSDGALHRGVDYIRDFIRSFHFGSEQFRDIPAPAEFCRLETVRENYMCLGELRGYLYIQCVDKGFQNLEIWVMKNYGVKESWIKDFVIDISHFEGSYISFQSIMIMDSGDIMILFGNSSVVLYNPYLQSFRTLNRMYEIGSSFEATIHIPCFISLKDVAKGVISKVGQE